MKLDRFFGRRGEDVENWLFHVNAAAKFSRWPDRCKLASAAMALSADARSEFRAFLGNDDVGNLTSNQFEAFLQEQFIPRYPTHHWTNKLMVCKQTARETVAEFASRFKQILLQLQNADPDVVSVTITVSRFQAGLRREFKDELERKPPKSLKEAIRTAETAERIWNHN